MSYRSTARFRAFRRVLTTYRGLSRGYRYRVFIVISEKQLLDNQTTIIVENNHYHGNNIIVEATIH